jgi:hypothetical protein
MMQYEPVLKKLKNYLMLLRSILLAKIHYWLRFRIHPTYDEGYCSGLGMVLGSLQIRVTRESIRANNPAVPGGVCW